jgi:methyl coenzyme M reductase subunit C-like uncharacterized protein (methanogenesis marker protein 7)
VAKRKSYWRIAGSRPDARSYICSPGHEYRNDYLKPGRTRISGYTLFKGYITSSIYFRFTIPENQLDKVKKGQENIHIPYKNKDIKGIVTTIKQLGAYGYCNHILIMKCRKACLK